MDRALDVAAYLFVPALFLAACGGKEDTLSFSRTSQDGLSTPLASLADCPALAANVTLTAHNGDIVITRACFKDDQGAYYDALLSDGPSDPNTPGIAVLPSGRTYAFVLQFGDGWVPSAAAVASPDIGKAFAAPTNIYSNEPCALLPEDQPGSRIPSTANLEGNVLTLAVSNPVADGNQVAVELDCDLAWGKNAVFCQDFLARFYVAHPPPVDGSVTCNYPFDAAAE